MGFLDRLFIEAAQECKDVDPPRPKATIIVPIHDFGEATARVIVGDMDGSGEAPGVEIQLAHDKGGPTSVALSGREAEALASVLLAAARRIPPSERLRPLRKRLKEGRKS